MEAKKSTFPHDNLITFRNSQGDIARGTLLKLTRTNIMMEVYNPYSIVQLSEVLSDLNISRGNKTIYEGRAIVSNLVNTGLMLIVSATLFDPWSEISNLEPGPELQEEVRHFIDNWMDHQEHLNPRYKLSTNKIRNFLQEFSRWLEQAEMSAGINEKEKGFIQELAENFAQDIQTASATTLDELFIEFNNVAETIPDNDILYHKTFARHELHPLLLCSPFMHRTFSKPLGYAGDYEMVNMIVKNRAQGANTYARVIDSILLRSGTAQAHRNRIDILLNYLVQESKRVTEENRPFKVLNIGCGPAFEVRQFIQNFPISDNAHFRLIDFNKETLEYTQEEIEKIIEENNRSTQLEYIHDSIHSLLKKTSKTDDTVINDKYDLVYCAGLFDYLSDKICSRLCELFYKQVRPGGAVIATNVSNRHSVKGILEHLQEWYLILRNEKDFAKLAPKQSRHKIFFDETGINIFLEARKPTIISIN